MGKGSAPRPIPVGRDEYARRWEETFGYKMPTPYKVFEELHEAVHEEQRETFEKLAGAE